MLPWLYSPFQVSLITNNTERKRLKILNARRQWNTTRKPDVSLVTSEHLCVQFLNKVLTCKSCGRLSAVADFDVDRGWLAIAGVVGSDATGLSRGVGGAESARPVTFHDLRNLPEKFIFNDLLRCPAVSWQRFVPLLFDFEPTSLQTL